MFDEETFKSSHQLLVPQKKSDREAGVNHLFGRYQIGRLSFCTAFRHVFRDKFYFSRQIFSESAPFRSFRDLSGSCYFQASAFAKVSLNNNNSLTDSFHGGFERCSFRDQLQKPTQHPSILAWPSVSQLHI